VKKRRKKRAYDLPLVKKAFRELNKDIGKLTNKTQRLHALEIGFEMKKVFKKSRTVRHSMKKIQKNSYLQNSFKEMGTTNIFKKFFNAIGATWRAVFRKKQDAITYPLFYLPQLLQYFASGSNSVPKSRFT